MWIILINCIVSLMVNEGRRGNAVECNGSVMYRIRSGTRTCTAQDMDLLGGILSEYPSVNCDLWFFTICFCDSPGDAQELRKLKFFNVFVPLCIHFSFAARLAWSHLPQTSHPPPPLSNFSIKPRPLQPPPSNFRPCYDSRTRSTQS